MTSTDPSFTREVRRDFDYARTELPGGDAVDDVYRDGKAPLNGGGSPATPKGQHIGRIWHRVTDGVWYATPDDGAWECLTWYHPFYSRREAAMFLLALSMRGI
jgi:hypothetical protein